MQKSDLTQGSIVKTRNGEIYILIGEMFVELEQGGFMTLDNYKEDLTLVRIYSIAREFDIVAVLIAERENSAYIRYKRNNLQWTWEREDAKEMTLEEIEQVLGYKIKIKR